jgi:hypothetical protein
MFVNDKTLKTNNILLIFFQSNLIYCFNNFTKVTEIFMYSHGNINTQVLIAQLYIAIGNAFFLIIFVFMQIEYL